MVLQFLQLEAQNKVHDRGRVVQSSAYETKRMIQSKSDVEIIMMGENDHVKPTRSMTIRDTSENVSAQGGAPLFERLWS